MIPNDVIAAAESAWRKWKVPASVSLAQWIVESGWGAHMPAGSNNPFGIKAIAGHPTVDALTHEFVRGRYVPITAHFAKFDDLEDAFDAHAKLLATHAAYHYAMQTTNAEEFAHRLAVHYATDPHYGDKLVASMRKYGLEKYDA